MRLLPLLALMCCVHVLAAADPSHSASVDAPLTIVCFGDSITGHRPAEAYQAHYVKYSDLLGLMVEARVGVGAVRMHNSGWAGDKTSPKPQEGWPGARGRVDTDIVDHRPAITTVLIGGNDRANTPEKAAVVEANLLAIVAAVEASGSKLLLLQYPPALPSEKHASEGWPLADYANPIIAKVAAATDTPLLDLGPAMLAADQAVGRKLLVNDKDGVHLKPGGEIVIARAIFRKFLELGWLN
jgi:lysophospholipase L1-like esterase